MNYKEKNKKNILVFKGLNAWLLNKIIYFK